MTTPRSALPLLTIAALLMAACGDDTPGPSGTTADAPAPDITLPAPDAGADDIVSIDGPWRLTSGSVDGEPVALVDGWDVTLTIDGVRIGGTAACNGYGGTVDTTGGAFVVSELSWTEMGCEPAVMALEQAFLTSLSGITSYTPGDGVLTLTGPSAAWVFEAQEPVPDADVVGATWVLDTYLDGETATSTAMMDLATLTLHLDGTLTGSTSCRRLEGEWLATGATIRFTTFSAIDDPTVGVCAPESQTLDGMIISVLEAGFTVEIDGDRLTLMAPGDEGLSYVRSNGGPTRAEPSPIVDDAAPQGGIDGHVVFAGETRREGEEALLVGELTLSGGCLRGGDDGVALVWQAGTRWQAEPPTVLLPTGERVPVGTTFEVGGGFHGDDGLRTWVTDVEALVELERCSAATGTFVIQHPVVVTEG